MRNHKWGCNGLSFVVDKFCNKWHLGVYVGDGLVLGIGVFRTIDDAREYSNIVLPCTWEDLASPDSNMIYVGTGDIPAAAAREVFADVDAALNDRFFVAQTPYLPF